MTQSLNILLRVWLTPASQVTFVFMPECAYGTNKVWLFALHLDVLSDALPCCLAAKGVYPKIFGYWEDMKALIDL